jgi:hypothetical protein
MQELTLFHSQVRGSRDHISAWTVPFSDAFLSEETSLKYPPYIYIYRKTTIILTYWINKGHSITGLCHAYWMSIDTSRKKECLLTQKLKMPELVARSKILIFFWTHAACSVQVRAKYQHINYLRKRTEACLILVNKKLKATSWAWPQAPRARLNFFPLKYQHYQ